MSFERLFLLREAVASCRIEGMEVSLDDVLIAMVREDERQARAARKRERDERRKEAATRPMQNCETK